MFGNEWRDISGGCKKETSRRLHTQSCRSNISHVEILNFELELVSQSKQREIIITGFITQEATLVRQQQWKIDIEILIVCTYINTHVWFGSYNCYDSFHIKMLNRGFKLHTVTLPNSTHFLWNSSKWKEFCPQLLRLPATPRQYNIPNLPTTPHNSGLQSSRRHKRSECLQTLVTIIVHTKK